MNFTEMHGLLRTMLRNRLDKDPNFSVTLLKKKTGLSQGHLSNFLHNKRSISNRTADRILQAQDLDLERLLRSKEPPVKPSHVSITEPRTAVPIVSEIAAINARFAPASAALTMLPLPPDALPIASPRTTSKRFHWERFVAIRMHPQQGPAMEPLILPEALVVLDRHDSTLKREYGQRLALYAVCCGGRLVVRYVTRRGDRLILRPHNQDHQVELIEIDPNQSADKWIIGRVVYVLNKMVR
jgi:hypothetical protein